MKKEMKKNFAGRIIAACICFTLLPLIMPVNISASEEQFTDVSKMSDKDFFGVWDSSKNEWTTKSKLNYDYSPDLAEVEHYAKLGGYSMAKETLAAYYKNRTSITRPRMYSDANEAMSFLTMHDMYNFSESEISTVNINTSDYTKYEINLDKTTASGVFMLASMTKDGDIVSIASKESGKDMSPKLELYYDDNTTKTVAVKYDSYTRAYDDNENYKTVSYGTEKELLVQDGYFRKSDGTYSPFSSKTRESYIMFDNSQITTTNLADAKLVIYAKLTPADGADTLTESSKEIIVHNAYNKSWREQESDAGTYPVLTWGNISHNHYSWNGVPGGFDWKAPEGASSEYANYNLRFYQQTALLYKYEETGDDSYIKKAIGITLDFINDSGAGAPEGRDIEAANRMLELVPALFWFLDYADMNGEALSAMLKYIYSEAEFLYSGKYYMNANNRGLWHTTGFFFVVNYLPEFADTADWSAKVNERLDALNEALIASDGCYVESTFGYPVAIVNFLIRNIEGYRDRGETPPGILYEKTKALVKYLIYITYPNGKSTEFGEGGSCNSRSMANNALRIFDDDEEIKYVATDGKEGTAPTYTTKQFSLMKLVSSRTSWNDDACMMMMQAKNGGNHNHKDSLAITLYDKDREVLSDTGMTSYDGKHPHFYWQRQRTCSHNTIEIDKTAQRGNSDGLTSSGDSDMELYSTTNADRLEAWTDATEGFRHHRDVLFFKNMKFLLVSDMVEPTDDKVHSYTQNWHTRPIGAANTIKAETGEGDTNFGSGSNVKIFQADMSGVTPSLETGYDAEGQSTTKYFCYTKQAAGKISYDTILLPTEEGNVFTTSLNSIDTGVDKSIASAERFTLAKNDEEAQSVVYYDSHEETPTAHTFGDYSTDAKMAAVVYDADDNIKEVILRGGTYLKKASDAIITADDAVDYADVVINNKKIAIESNSDQAKKIKIRSSFIPESVTLNGNIPVYTYSSGEVYLNSTAAETAAEDGIKYGGNVMVSGTTYGVTAEFEKGTQVSEGTFSAPEIKESDGKIGVIFNSFKVNKPVIIKISAGTGSTAYLSGTVISGKSGITDENADEMLADSYEPACVTSRNSTAIYSKTLGSFTVSPPVYKNPTTGGGGGGGGGGGTPAKATATPQPSAVPTSEPSATATPQPASSSVPEFTDIADSWAADNIKYMAQKNYVSGYPDNTFRPNADITRAEFISMLMKIVGTDKTVNDDNAFADVDTAQWFCGSVSAAKEKGIIAGDGKLFYPLSDITRQEVALIISRAYKNVYNRSQSAEVYFRDRSAIAEWALEGVSEAVGDGLMKGTDEEMFRPLQNMDRAEAVTVFRRFVDAEKEEKTNADD